MFTRRFLNELRRKAVRRRVLYSAIDGLERGILYLTARTVDRVSSPTLIMQLAEIVMKLQEAMESGFRRHLKRFGPRRLVEIVKQAVEMGSESAVDWVTDRGFLRYLTFLDFNQQAGYRAA